MRKKSLFWKKDIPILENEVYRRRTNEKVQQIYQKFVINAYLMINEWACHVWWSNGILKKVLIWKINGKRSMGFSRQHWTDRAHGDLNKCIQGVTIVDSIDKSNMEECCWGSERPSTTIKTQ